MGWYPLADPHTKPNEERPLAESEYNDPACTHLCSCLWGVWWLLSGSYSFAEGWGKTRCPGKGKGERKQGSKKDIRNFQTLSIIPISSPVNALAVNDLGTVKSDMHSPCCHKHPFAHNWSVQTFVKSWSVAPNFCPLFWIVSLLLLPLGRTHWSPQNTLKYLPFISRIFHIWLYIFSFSWMLDMFLPSSCCPSRECLLWHWTQGQQWPYKAAPQHRGE